MNWYMILTIIASIIFIECYYLYWVWKFPTCECKVKSEICCEYMTLNFKKGMSIFLGGVFYFISFAISLFYTVDPNDDFIKDVNNYKYIFFIQLVSGLILLLILGFFNLNIYIGNKIEERKKLR